MQRTLEIAGVTAIFVVCLFTWHFIFGPHFYENSALGVTFRYPRGYVLSTHQEASRLGHELAVVLTPKASVTPVASEPEPTITLDIYRLNEGVTVEDWIRGRSDSNFYLGTGELESADLGDQSAVRYHWSGLYEGTTLATARNGHLYLLAVTSIAPDDKILDDARLVIESFRFN